MAQYDLTPVISQYLDKHLVITLIEFLQEQKLYSSRDLLQRKVDLFGTTNMLDLYIDLHQQLHGDAPVPAEILAKREVALQRLNTRDEDTRIFEFLEREEVKRLIKESTNPEALLESLKEYGFEVEMLDLLHSSAKFNFDIGEYGLAAQYLYNYRILCTDQEKSFTALWGLFAALILDQQWDRAHETHLLLKSKIDEKRPGVSHVLQLQQRTWFLHWCLFFFFLNKETQPATQGLEELISLFLNDREYSNAMQTTSPHLLRYVAAAVVICRGKRDALKDLVRVVQQEGHAYRDPITELIECLYVNFDFEAAQSKLKECEQVLSNDFFLASLVPEFLDNARLFIFETYMRMHKTMSISMLSSKLCLEPQTAELWVVNLIRDARLDAKIDSQKGCVELGCAVVSVYHSVIERTKDLHLRSRVMSENIDRKGKGEKTSGPRRPNYRNNKKN